MTGVDAFGLAKPGRGGLVIARTAAGDFHIQSTHASLKKQEQFENLRSRWAQGDRPRSAGGELIVSLALHDAVLDAAHVAAIGRSGEVWTDGVAVALDWRLEHGWRDRRYLSAESSNCVRDNGGVSLTTLHWRDAATYLRMGSALEEPVIRALFDAAAAGWYFELPGLLYCHCARLAPLQPLTRAAHARRVCGRPLLAGPTDPAATRRAAIELGLQMARRPSSRLECAHRIRQMFTRRVLKASEQKVRQQWTADLLMLFEEACGHGRAQGLIVAGTLHIVEEGGIRGALLKPRSLTSYVGDTVELLLKAMVAQGGDPDGYTAEIWHEIYMRTIEQAKESVRAKVAAFLAAFHRMLVGRGAPPLPHPICPEDRPEPPAALALFDAELERARAYVLRTAGSERIGLQAELMLLIGKVVAIRTSEVFTLRVGDVLEGPAGACVLAIAPRLNDGTAKTPAVRRHVEIRDVEAIDKLLAFRRRRLNEDAASGDFLFGEPRRPGERHAERQTTELVQAAIKTATGDRSASYYCLRHRVLSDQVAAALMPDAQTCDEPRLLGSLAGRAGHASIVSSRPYINRFEAALQAWAARSRGCNSTASTEGFERVERGRDFALQAALVDADALPDSPGTVKPAHTPGTVLAVLDDVARDHSLAATALRNDLSEESVNDVLAASFACLASIGLGPAVCSRHPQLDAISLVQRLRVWWRASHQPKYQRLRERLAETVEREPRLLDRTIGAWQSAYRREELSLDHFEAAAPLLRFLQSCDVPNRRLLVTCALERVPLHLQPFDGRSLVVNLVPPRAGRPRVRLHLSSVDASAGVPAGPAIAVQGLHAWMLAAAICRALREPS